MEIKEIKNKVKKAIEELKTEFETHPKLFYTEGDIVCRLFDIAQKNLSYKKIKDSNGCSHYIIHREYSTPFRCSMENGFKIKLDDERTDGGHKYRRGRYDIVVLNPNFIQKYEYDIIKGQNYNSIKSYLNTASQPAIVYGIEVMFNRDPLTSKGIDDFVAKVKKDYDKLQKSKTLNNVRFMECILMLIFDNTSSEYQKRLNETLKENLGLSTEWCFIPNKVQNCLF